jgi:ankyrin repeat protein
MSLAIWILLAVTVFVNPIQKYATPSDALVFEGRTLWNQGRKQDAIEKVKEAIRIDSTRPDLHLELAGMYWGIGEMANARSAVDAAVKADQKPYALSRLLYGAIGHRRVNQFGAVLEVAVDKNKDELLLYVISQKETPSIGIVELLIAKGARVNQPVKYKTALMHAARQGHVEIAKLLLAKGAEVNVKTDEGTPLTMAASGGHPQIVKLLLDAGADVNTKDRLGNAALILSAGRSVAEMNPRPYEAPPSSAEVMSLLLAKGADPNGRVEWGRTALMEANSAAKVNLLVARGADVNAKDDEGETALTRAVDRGDAEVAEALLKAGAGGINAQNEDRQTILMRAITSGKTELVKLLLAQGADVNPRDALGNTAAVLAYEKDQTEIVALLKSAPPSPETVNAFLRVAVHKKDEAKVRELLAGGADANYEYTIGHKHPDIKTRVLIDAVRVGHVGIVQLLLARGADPNATGLIEGSEHGLKFGTALEATENAEIISLLRKAIAKGK